MKKTPMLSQDKVTSKKLMYKANMQSSCTWKASIEQIQIYKASNRLAQALQLFSLIKSSTPSRSVSITRQISNRELTTASQLSFKE